MSTYNSTIRTRIDLDDKNQANENLKKLGLSLSDYIRLAVKALNSSKKIPFEINIPNDETLAAIEELEQGKGSKASSIKDLFDNLTK